QGAAVGAPGGHDDGLEGRRREVPQLGVVRRPRAERVADAYVGQAPEPGDAPGTDLAAALGAAAVVDGDGRDLALAPVAERDAVAHMRGARHHAGERDLLARRAPLDLEHAGDGGAVRVA